MNRIRAKIINVAKSGSVALVKFESLESFNSFEVAFESAKSAESSHQAKFATKQSAIRTQTKFRISQSLGLFSA